MRSGKNHLIATVMGCLVHLPSGSMAEGKQEAVSFQSQAESFLADHCTSCHGEEKQKGEITLHDIGMDFGSAEEGQRWMAVLLTARKLLLAEGL